MSDERNRQDGGTGDPRASFDVRIDTPGREGLTGTTPATLYKPLPVRDQITLPPDGRPPEAQPQWRKDFPIDWPQDHYVARRDFAKFMVLTSLAFFVGQVWIGVQNRLRRASGQPEIRRIATLASLPVGGVQVFDYPGEHDTCLLIRTGPDRLLAYSKKCTHLSCAVYFQPEQRRRPAVTAGPGEHGQEGPERQKPEMVGDDPLGHHAAEQRGASDGRALAPVARSVLLILFCLGWRSSVR